MLNVPAAIAAQIANRQGIVVRNLFWIKAKNRTDGFLEELGIWSGSDDRDFVVSGVNRTYYGAGAFLGFSDFAQESGVVIKSLTVNTAPMAPEVQNALRLYDPKFAPIEVHQVFFDPETMNQLANPLRRYKGWVDTISINTPVQNGNAIATINCVSNARILTRIVPSKRSNENQVIRNPSDTFFADVAISGTIKTPWAEKTVDPPVTTSVAASAWAASRRF